ncbi:gfo/Idh/MocA family oxidoreductase [Mariniphaga sediminis]|uniref:Gfo/Idh/MocA family oxidoreductase n=1 Tax=Mariniphaga sediminis TaxID=1628158 RepID=A0A399D675_9BACT|nr:Gfo/Idh/MocA family oxidoreductase [Mariniphaga sediminis]RIH67006.1 gfo/Idh/MocA family oxidoreductase [Mariniphaga sediminis]
MNINRRNFINTTVTGITGISLGASIFPLHSCHMVNDKIILGLIGSGTRGTRSIICTCRCNENVEIKTICDVNELKATKAIKEIEKELGYRPVFVKNMKEVFNDKDIDAVWISTPDHWHALATIWACQSGKDVYVEKNPTISIWEGRKMIEAVEKYKRIVQIGFQNRSASSAFSARSYIKSGKLGKIIHVKCFNLLSGKKWIPKPNKKAPGWINWDAWLGPAPYRPYNPAITTSEERSGWFDFWAFGGGVLSDETSHVMDLARFVIGDPPQPKSVFAYGGNWPWGSEKETPEFISITYDFEGFTMTCDSGNATNYMKKTPNNILMNSNLFPDWRINAMRIEIYGTEGLMYLGPHGSGWQVIGENSEIIAQDGGTMPDMDHQQNFIESIRSRKQPNGDVVQGQLSACLVHLANIAYRTGNKQLYFDSKNEQFTNDKKANEYIKTTYRENYKIPDKI